MGRDVKKIISKAIKKTPVVGGVYKERDELRYVTNEQKNEITGLREAVHRLEERNDEWAREVRTLRGDDKQLEILWPVFKQDLIDADFTQPLFEKLSGKRNPPFMFNWVVPPLGSVSGGHAVIFRTIQFLESQGHTCRVYFYDPMYQVDFKTIKENLNNHHQIKAELFYNEEKMKDCDGMFATGWTTAYPVFNFKGVGKKFYFIQDYEAIFEASGTYSTLADNTYRMGLHGITTSPWMASKLSEEYDMSVDTLELAVAQGEYSLTNTKKRKKILFYARPVTPRRGFELGTLALEIFHKKHPEYEINFIGWDTERYNIPFPYVNNKILGRKELNALYNECVAGLVLSFTSMSLLPVEMMAAGCQPVVNDANYTRMVGYANGIEYAAPSPQRIAAVLSQLVEEAESGYGARPEKLADYSKQFNWSETDIKLTKILMRELSS